MPENVSILIAALIGAIIGSIGAVIIEKRMESKAQKASARASLIQQYLFQFQDSIEALWYRLDNLAFRQGIFVMKKEYFEVSTLYTLGKVLAMERILALEGIYPQMEILYPTLGQFLKEHRIDLQLQDRGIFQYDLLTLAESVIEREGQHFRASTFLEFRRLYEGVDSPERLWLTPAKEAMQSLPKLDTLLDSLQSIAIQIAEKTKIPSSLKDQPKKIDTQSG